MPNRTIVPIGYFASVAEQWTKNVMWIAAPDILMLHCLKCDSSMEARYELAALPFESVVDHPTFRDKHGLLYLLRHMHLAQSDPALQVLLFFLYICSS
eukprot:SAG31_NODE_546_length_14230_cov_18.112660_10_plen_98_part_00